jgi:outer membrane murein-binding lipoprotein Lpp
MSNEDIPSLTLCVLEKIQGELVGLRGDVGGLRSDVHALNQKVDTLNDRFDHFLTFVDRDVQDLKARVTKLEQDRHP